MQEKFLVMLVDEKATGECLKEEQEELDAVGGRIEAVNCKDEQEIIAACAQADVITTDALHIGRQVFEALPNLKAVIRRGVGYDVVDLEAATENGVAVVNIPFFCGEEVSNQVLLFILNFAKKFKLLNALTQEGKWTQAKNSLKPMAAVHGQTLGIVGCGRLGQMVAKKARALDMRVIGYDAYLPKQIMEENGIESVEFEQLLAQSDYVTLHVTLNESTRHMINAQALGKMKSTAFLINTSRGPVVDEAALIQALRDKQIAGAGLDVFEKEPVDPENPLLRMENVLVMPHSASYSDAAFSLLRTKAGQEAVRVARGQMPENVVNKGVVSKHGLK